MESADGDLEAVADEEDDDDGDERDGGADRPPLFLPQARRQRPIEGSEEVVTVVCSLIELSAWYPTHGPK